jgi:glycosyltransferase involved in cell wall biosynthesis
MNEADSITRCLKSVLWCDEIIVIDSGSTDGTKEICESFGARVIYRAWTGYVDQKAFGLEQCQYEWALNLDADEEVSNELRQEIEEILKDGGSPYNGYELSRVVFYLKRWWRKGGWYPEYRMRLCRKSHTTWAGADPHERAVVSGPTKKLNGELYHFTYSDVADHIERLNNHSTSAARTMLKRGQKFSVLQMIANPLGRFLKFYIIKGGAKEGLPGFQVAIVEAFYVFLKYYKLWELERTKTGERGSD